MAQARQRCGDPVHRAGHDRAADRQPGGPHDLFQRDLHRRGCPRPGLRRRDFP
ncbi:hypothetical protein GCM10009660_60840 [Catellatospora bangladeshensis]